MNLRLLTAVIGLSSLALPVSAETIRGTISLPSGADSADVIVWLDGDVDGQPASGQPRMSQKGATFAPAFMVVVAGQAVEMPNDDNIAHNVFSFSTGNDFNLGIYPKGTSKSVTFNTPGLVDIFCSIHRHMSAQILVVPNAHFAFAEADGTFELSGVPAGDYTLKTYAKNHTELSTPVSVSASGSVSLDITLNKE